MKIIFIVLVGSIFLVVFFAFGVNYFLSSEEDMLNAKNVALDEKVEIDEVSLSEIQEDKNESYRDKDGRLVVFNGNSIGQVFFSPSGKKVGFMENRNIYDKNIPYDQTRILYIGNAQDKNFQEIFHGSFRMSGWEWFSENEVIFNSSCGTECQVVYWSDLDSGEKSVLQYGVGYEWSSDKKLVFAYHYSGNYGIVIGDKKGKELFSFVREHKKFNSESLSWKTKAVWSQDSTRLALAIKKENEEKMELLIFDIENDFEQLYKRDINDKSEEYNLKWSDDKKIIFVNNEEISMHY